MRRIAVLLLVALGALAAGDALAKGPIEATIEGPGLTTPIQIGDWDNFGQEDALANHQPIMQLAEAAGFFDGTFGGPRLESARPAGPLGPRYVATYRVPGPNNDEFRIVQHLYPYAEPTAVTYTPPGQRIFERDGTPGGWYAADDANLPQLTRILVEAGLPESGSAAVSDGESFPWGVVLASVLMGLALVAVLALGLHKRHRTAAT